MYERIPTSDRIVTHVCGEWQMSELAFDFAEGLVVGLGIKGEEKALLLKKWTEFSSNSVTYMVRAKPFPCATNFKGAWCRRRRAIYLAETSSRVEPENVMSLLNVYMR